MFYDMPISHGQKVVQANKIKSFIKKTSKQSDNSRKKIERRTSKAISKLLKQEKRLLGNLEKVDKFSSLSNYTMGVDSLKFYNKLIKLKELPNVNPVKMSRYSALLDTAKCILKFIDDEDLSGKIPKDITKALQKIAHLEHGIGASTQFENYIKNRRAELSSILSRYEPNNRFNKILKCWGKEYHYYGETIKNYQSILDDPSKIQAKVFEVARSIPAFNDFMKENGDLASIFSGHVMQDYTGLQTREQVNDQIKAQLAQLGSKGKDILSGKLDEGKQILENASEEFAINENDQSEKDFKPNSQKTKTFWQRVEIGTDFQFNRKTKELPMSVTTGLTVGFKLHDKLCLGAGIGANLNIGNDLKHPSPSAEKVVFRSFSEYGLGKEFFIRAGWERSFIKTVTSFENLNRRSYFYESALIGISKSIPSRIKVPFLKKKVSGKVMLLYDFLYKTNKANASPVIFRVGYNF